MTKTPFADTPEADAEFLRGTSGYLKNDNYRAIGAVATGRELEAIADRLEALSKRNAELEKKVKRVVNVPVIGKVS